MTKRANKTILLAEDDPNDVFIIQRAFKQGKIAHNLVVVSNGDEAIGYLKGTGDFADRKKYPLPDLTLLDIKMPKKNGLEVLQHIRKDPILKSLVVVMLSSSSQMTDVTEAHAL